MIRFEEIHYLRWARDQACEPYPEIGLILSGMEPPDPSILGSFDTAELLKSSSDDHPPLAHHLAEEWHVSPEQVLVQPGSHWSILVATASRLNTHPGPVIVEDPAYEPLLRIPEALGADVLRWPRAHGNGFSFDPGALDRLAAAKPSLVILTHPHNPSGAVLGQADVSLLRELQERTGCAILSDELYLEFLQDPAENTLLHACADTLIIRSFTKVFGLGALRVSALAGEKSWIDRAAIFTDHGPVTLPAPSATMAMRAWECRHELWERARGAARAGRPHVEEFLTRCEDLLECRLPESGIICFPRLRENVHRAVVAGARANGTEPPVGYGLERADDGSQVWIEDLRRRSGVQLTPGQFFGDSRAFRIGFGIDAEAVREGLQRAETYLREQMERA